ncbi:DUF1648 domain-containing protein [Arthrobacter sp. LAPM80]|uniref:DUF1648 domain-containing protein n=1 Tax=Arthrobacter sp. LAPM80 TaxID=3141788 RepID=UPI00398AFE66
MGEQVRCAAAEATYNRWWLIGLFGGHLILGILAATWMFTVAARLPGELAIHWNAKGEVDGWTSLWGIATTTVLTMVGVGGIIAVLAVVSRGQNTLIARIGAGVGVGFGIGAGALMVAVVAGQIGLADTSRAEISGPVMGAGLGLAAVLGVLPMWLYRPGEMDRTQSPAVLAANDVATAADSPLVAQAQERAARGESLRVKVSMGARAWLLCIGVGGVVALSTYFIFPVLSVLGVAVAAIIWVFCQGTAIIGADGVKVLASGLWRVMPLEWKEIHKATVEDIQALDYGGWGFRINGGSVGFIMGSGPAIVIDAGFHQTFVISMPDAQTAAEAAALVNAYVHTTTVQN